MQVPEDQIYIAEATRLFDKALEVDPACGMCHGQYGDMFKDAHKVMKAIEHYTLSAQLLPHVPTIFCNLVYTKLFACDWRAYDADFDRLLAMVRHNPKPPSLTPPPKKHLARHGPSPDCSCRLGVCVLCVFMYTNVA